VIEPKIDDQLKKAVTEYYEYQGDTDAVPVRFVTNKMPGKYKMLLVRFTDQQEKEPVEMSALMVYQEWNDGHWDVTEMDVRPRECEDCLVRDFEESEEYI
jgi:hypothetical protein